MKELIVSPGGIKKLQTDVKQHRSDMAIIADGDVHAVIAAGQYVDVKNHSSLADGVYKNKLTTAIGVNAALSASNLERASSGGLNALKAEVDALNSKIANKIQLIPFSGTTDVNGNIVIGNGKIYIIAAYVNNYIGTPFYYSASNSTYIKLSNIGDTLSPAANINVSGYYYKIEW